MDRNTLMVAQDRYWYQRAGLWRRRVGESDDIDDTMRVVQEISRLSFEAGARWNFQETARLSPAINQFLEMCVLLGPTDH